jgi:hypothetical protein
MLECCAAVREQSQTRYLCNKAPMLPLPDCSNASQCRCKYRHWQDRRQEDRRALKWGIASLYFNGADRRSDAERRSR